MRKQILLSALSMIAINPTVFAGETIASFSCQGKNVAVQVNVESPGTVAWNVTNLSGRDEKYMGYLFGNVAKDFSSTDLGSDLEISGSSGKITLEEGDISLTCGRLK